MKEVSDMGEQPKKAHISAGLLAHVCASRGVPHNSSPCPVKSYRIILKKHHTYGTMTLEKYLCKQLDQP